MEPLRELLWPTVLVLAVIWAAGYVLFVLVD